MILPDKFKGILKSIAVLSIFSLLFLANKAHAETFLFNRDLKLGDSGQDVLELQKILNTNPTTAVANDGPGSASNETTNFGMLTKLAVVSFQEMYSSEILAPNGLTLGTGFVGPSTRAKLNSLSGASNSPVTTSPTNPVQTPTNPGVNGSPSTDQSPSAFIQSIFPQKISVFSASKYQVSPGGMISINGSGFLADGNILHIGDSVTVPLDFASTTSSDGSMALQGTVPSSLPTGKYEIWVTKGQNGIGADSSRNSSMPVFVLVTTNPLPPPTISNISPSPADASGQLTISGTGFTSTGNNIYSTLGNILNVPSSGGAIMVRISDFPGAGSVRKPPGNSSIEIDGWLYVQNDNGVNNMPAAFKIMF